MKTWIAPKHLTDDAITEYAAQFRSDPNGSICIDDFLLPARLEDLRQLFRGHGKFEPVRQSFTKGTRRKPQHVTDEEWAALPRNERFQAVLQLVGSRAPVSLELGWISYLQLRGMLNSKPFLGFLGKITGMTPVALLGVPARIMQGTDFVTPHNDAKIERDLCSVFYASERWDAEDGGRFRFVTADRSATSIDPLPNRLLLFRLSRRSFHDVEPMASHAPPRWTFSLWFGDNARAQGPGTA